MTMHLRNSETLSSSPTRGPMSRRQQASDACTMPRTHRRRYRRRIHRCTWTTNVIVLFLACVLKVNAVRLWKTKKCTTVPLNDVHVESEEVLCYNYVTNTLTTKLFKAVNSTPQSVIVGTDDKGTKRYAIQRLTPRYKEVRDNPGKFESWGDEKYVGNATVEYMEAAENATIKRGGAEWHISKANQYDYLKGAWYLSTKWGTLGGKYTAEDVWMNFLKEVKEMPAIVLIDKAMLNEVSPSLVCSSDDVTHFFKEYLLNQLHGYGQLDELLLKEAKDIPGLVKTNTSSVDLLLRSEKRSGEAMPDLPDECEAEMDLMARKQEEEMKQQEKQLRNQGSRADTKTE